MMTLRQSARYHGKVGALTLLGGALSIHGATAAEALGEGAVEGLRQWLIRVIGGEATYDLLQRAADAVGDEIVGMRAVAVNDLTSRSSYRKRTL